MASKIEYFEDQGTQGYVGVSEYQGRRVVVKVPTDVNLLPWAEHRGMELALETGARAHFCQPVTVLDKGEVPLLLMEHLDGVCLQNLKPLGKEALRRYLSLAYQATAGLAALHLGSVAHCDLHTGNVMACADAAADWFVYTAGPEVVQCVPSLGRRAVIIDFGLATLPGRSAFGEDSFVSMGYTPNGEPDYVGDARILLHSFHCDTFAAADALNDRRDVDGQRLKKCAKFFRTMLSWLPRSQRDYLKRVPDYEEALQTVVPGKIAKHFRDVFLTDLANLCKMRVPKPYVWRPYGAVEAAAVWIDLLDALGYPEPQQYRASLESVREHLMEGAHEKQLGKPVRAMGEMAAAFTARCYEQVYDKRAEMRSRCWWNNAAEILLSMPPFPWTQPPRLGDSCTVICLKTRVQKETVFDAAMLDAVGASRVRAKRLAKLAAEVAKRPCDQISA